jgi:ArsR family transcriptional regulator
MNLTPDTVFSAIANPDRLRALLLLSENEELCVCELTYVLGLAQPNMSRHLSQMRDLGIVADRREGRWIYYRLNPELPSWIRNVLDVVVKTHFRAEPYRSDRMNLSRMPNRPGAPRCA